tara:strand:+ start:23 stop:361 length:339 start_codon:yes stop_codon:yes gene_type:complete
MTQSATGTKFQKDQFRWDGTYLHYMGRHTESKNWDELHPNCHPSLVGVNKMEFIARFKVRKPYKTWINFLVKNFTVEEYLGLINYNNPNHVPPLTALESKGFVPPHRKYKRG